jgi:hypothetical protein
MLWPRQICPFGLPNDGEDEAVGDTVLVSIGHFLRVTATDIDQPLPVRLAGLLRQLDRVEQSGRGKAVLRRRRDIPREPIRPAVRQPANRQTDASAEVAIAVGPLICDEGPIARRAAASAS